MIVRFDSAGRKTKVGATTKKESAAKKFAPGAPAKGATKTKPGAAGKAAKKFAPGK